MKHSIKFTCLIIASMLQSACGPTVKTGTVKGKVTLAGKPVAGLLLNIVQPSKGIGASATLDETGTFSIPEELPVGDYNVSLTPLVPIPPTPGQPLPKYVPPSVIPKRYTQEETSGLKIEVKPGENDVDLNLLTGS